MGGFTHLNERGKARMVDITMKTATLRTALASCEIRTVVPVGNQERSEIELAGVMGGYRTADLIPLCHPIPVGDIAIAVEPVVGGYRLTAQVESTGPTGVEMEALTAVTIAALNLVMHARSAGIDYSIENVMVLRKSGGKSGDWGREVS